MPALTYIWGNFDKAVTCDRNNNNEVNNLMTCPAVDPVMCGDSLVTVWTAMGQVKENC